MSIFSTYSDKYFLKRADNKVTTGGSTYCVRMCYPLTNLDKFSYRYEESISSCLNDLAPIVFTF